MVFFVTIGYILLRSRPFQNWAAQKTVNYLSKELKTRVALKSIDFELVNNLVLEGLYIEDRQGDTLAYFGKLKTSFNYKIIFDNKLQLARIRHAVIEDTKVNMIVHKGLRDFNYQFIIDYFSPPRPKSNKPFVPFKLFIKNLELKNVDYCFKNENDTQTKGRKFDESNMVYQHINAQIKPFNLIGDSLNLGIKTLTFKEKSGFEVKEFSANTTISSTMMEFEDLIFKTRYSKIGNYLKFKYKDYEQLSNFIDSVKWDVNLSKSVVSMKDVSYFSDELLKYKFPVTIMGSVTGTLANLKGQKMDITVGKLNHLRGDILLKDLTNMDKLAFDLSIFDLTANPSSIQDLINTKFPEELLRIGSLCYTGTFTGVIKDFTTKGLIETTIGNIRTDLNLKFPDGKPEEYKGEVEAFNFNMGKLLNDGLFGTTTFFTVADGKGFTMKDLNTKLQGDVVSFIYDGYDYSNATFDGVLEKKVFNGTFDIKDPNVNLSFNGMFDLNKESPGGDFKAKLGVVNLAKLGYGDINIKQIDNVDISFEGNDIDDMKISAILNHVVLERKDSIYQLGTIDLNAFGPYQQRSVVLNSILGNINITGQFKISQFESTIDNLLYDLFPDYYAKLKTKANPVNIRFDMDISDSRFLSALVMPELTFSKLTTTGVYNSTSQSMDILARAEYVKYTDYSFKEVAIESSKQPGQRLTFTTKSSALYVTDSFLTDNINLAADMGGNDINFRLNTSDTLQDVSIISGGNIIFSKGAIDLKLANSVLYLYKKPWIINNQNHLHYAQSNLSVDSFNISKGNQSLSINGLAGEKKFENLKLNISNFNLAEINPILQTWNSEIQGIINGNLTLNGSNNRPIVESSLTIDNLAYNKDSVGDVVLNSHSHGSPYKMDIDGTIKNGLINDLSILGNVDLTPNNDKIDLVCTLNETNIKPFEMFTEGLFSNITGLANGVINVKGALSKPDIDGKIVLKDASFFMDYLGLPLKVDFANVLIDEKKIDLGTFKVKDKYGSVALAGGKIYHKNFNDFRFDIFMNDLKNFNCMDLTEDKNDMFFGTAFVDGKLKVTGTIDQIYLSIYAKTRPKTVISLPLSSTTENTGPDYIKIVDLRADMISTETKKLSGITMDFNFDVTTDAEVNMIFDAKFDDVMSVAGNGNIKMELNTFGDFYMFGSYVIDKGRYNFTALNNLVNTKLKVKSGSKITWEGDPLNAMVDIVAITTVKADPSVILPSTSTSQTTNNVAVDCEIYMKDNLFKPDIRLGINLSKDNQSTLFANLDLNNAINQIRADQEETNKQFINLLVFNSFAPINSAGTASSGNNALSSFENSIGAFVTNQVNSWLRQIDPNWEAAVNYQSATSSDANKQIILSLKRKLYNDRIEIGGTYGQSGNTSYDVNVSYKVKKDGRLLIRGFNNRANDPINVNNKPINTSGVGFYYRKELDYFFPKWQKKKYDRKHK